MDLQFSEKKNHPRTREMEIVKKKRYPVSQSFSGVSAAQYSGHRPALKWDYGSVEQSVRLTQHHNNVKIGRAHV